MFACKLAPEQSVILSLCPQTVALVDILSFGLTISHITLDYSLFGVIITISLYFENCQCSNLPHRHHEVLRKIWSYKNINSIL